MYPLDLLNPGRYDQVELEKHSTAVVEIRTERQILYRNSKLENMWKWPLEKMREESLRRYGLKFSRKTGFVA